VNGLGGDSSVPLGRVIILSPIPGNELRGYCRRPSRTARTTGERSARLGARELNCHSFAGRFHQHIGFFLPDNLPGVLDKGIDAGIVMIGVMVKQAELPHAGLDGQVNSIIHAAMSPAQVTMIFLGIILGIENQHIGAPDEFPHFVIHAARTRLRIRKKCDQAIGRKEAVSDAESRMVGAQRPDADGPDIEIKILNLLDLDIAGQIGKMDRKISAFHLTRQSADQTLAGAFTSQNFQATARIVNRPKKRQSLNMIPMGVGNEESEIKRLAFKLLQQGLTQQTEPGAGVENNDLITATDLNTGSISPVTDGARAGSRDGSTYAPKLDGGGSSDGGIIPDRAKKEN